MHVCEAEIASLKAVGQSSVVQAEQVEDGRVQVMHVDLVFDGVKTEVVRLAEQSLAALDDNGQTLSRLARLDEQGAFGTPDSERQMGWLQAAADAGDASAMMRLYRSYASGIGVPASPDEAIAWLQKAADIGDPRAATELAAAYTVGFGTEADPERAAFWRARAQVN